MLTKKSSDVRFLRLLIQHSLLRFTIHPSNCFQVVQKISDDISDYTGPDALGLLEGLFVGSSCAYRAEPYWTYELCHGKHLRQYHEERDGKQIKVQEYFLGKFNKNLFDELIAEHKKDVANGITRHPPTKMIEKIAMPYYEITMTDGTMCDLTNLPRRTRVLYTCYPNGRNEIYSFKETSTCDYEVVVLTATLCKHPRYFGWSIIFFEIEISFKLSTSRE